MCPQVAVVYNEPVSSRYDTTGEEKAVRGVLESVAAVEQALAELGYAVGRVPLAPPVTKAAILIDSLVTDVVFNLFEGFPGYPETEAWLPEVLEKRGVPYTGCPAPALALALDKARTKDVLRAAGIATPTYMTFTAGNPAGFNLSFPCIVKPAAEDASHGLTEDSIVNDMNALAEQVKRIGKLYGGRVLVEEFLDGRDFNATVLGNKDNLVLPISEITYTLPPGKPRMLTFAAKWDEDSVYYRNTPVVCPARINDTLKEDIGRVALAAFRVLGCRGYARVDMRLDKNGNVNVIEVNPNPDISPSAGVAHQVKAAGMTYTGFIGRLIALAEEGTQL